MRSDLEPDFAYVFGTSRDDRYYGIELEKLSFSHSGPLGRAAKMLHERFHLTGAQHGENFFERKPKPQTGYETKQNAFRRVDNAEALAYLVCCLAAELIDPPTGLRPREVSDASGLKWRGLRASYWRKHHNRGSPRSISREKHSSSGRGDEPEARSSNS
jgi:hypothetical protein